MFTQTMENKIPKVLITKVNDYYYLRNQLIHIGVSTDKKVATDVVKTVNEIVQILDRN